MPTRTESAESSSTITLQLISQGPNVVEPNSPIELRSRDFLMHQKPSLLRLYLRSTDSLFVERRRTDRQATILNVVNAGQLFRQGQSLRRNGSYSSGLLWDRPMEPVFQV